MIEDDTYNMEEDDRPPLLVVEEEDEPIKAPEELVGLDDKLDNEIPKELIEEQEMKEEAERIKKAKDLERVAILSEPEQIIEKAKLKHEEDEINALYRSPLRGPYEG